MWSIDLDAKKNCRVCLFSNGAGKLVSICQDVNLDLYLTPYAIQNHLEMDHRPKYKSTKPLKESVLGNYYNFE